MPTPEKRASELIHQADALRKIAAEMQASDPKTAAYLVEMAANSESKAVGLRAMPDELGP